MQNKIGLKTALIGPSGTGKTHSIRSLIAAGITPFIIFTEDSRSMLSDLPADKCHWAYISPSASNWGAMIDSAKKINTLPFQALTALKDVNKNGYKQFIDVLELCNNFVCERTGESFGDVSSWGTDRCLVLDSLSGLNEMAMSLVVGSKPVKSMSDWGVAMDNLSKFITKLCTGLDCHVLMTAHVDRQQDEVTGGIKLMMSTLGKKLPSLLPRFFDEVIMTKYDGNEFYWSTSEHNCDLKTRFLEHAPKLPPSFVPLIKAWDDKFLEGQAPTAN